ARAAATIYAMADSVDVLITGGTVYDGTGAAGRRADVAVRGDRIVEMGDLPDAQAPRVVDATGLAVTPGFIDTHTHSDMACFLGDDHLDLKAAALRQGGTTEACGNCGFTPFPMLDPHRGAPAPPRTRFATAAGPSQNPH